MAHPLLSDKRDDHRGSICVVEPDHFYDYMRAERKQFLKGKLNFTKLDTLAAQLNLCVLSTEDADGAMSCKLRQVSGSVQFARGATGQ
jgi:hypothetical protein